MEGEGEWDGGRGGELYEVLPRDDVEWHKGDA